MLKAVVSDVIVTCLRTSLAEPIGAVAPHLVYLPIDIVMASNTIVMTLLSSLVCWEFLSSPLNTWF